MSPEEKGVVVVGEIHHQGTENMKKPGKGHGDVWLIDRRFVGSLVAHLLEI